MSRGLGTTQQAIMTALGENPRGSTVDGLAAQVSREPAQVRTALRALHARSLIVRERAAVGWKAGHMPIAGWMVWSVPGRIAHLRADLAHPLGGTAEWRAEIEAEIHELEHR